jgi:hypothetical protein
VWPWNRQTLSANLLVAGPPGDLWFVVGENAEAAALTSNRRMPAPSSADESGFTARL